MRNDRIGPAAPPPEQCTDARAQLVQVEGFDEIVVSSSIQASNACMRSVARAHDENGHEVGAGPQPFQHLDAIRARKPEVEDHEVVHAGGRLRQRFGAIAHPIHGVALVAQGFLHTAADEAIVFNEQ